MKRTTSTKENVLHWWNESDTGFTNRLRSYSEPEQQAREQQFGKFMQSLRQKTKKANGSYEALRLQKDALLLDMADFFRCVLDYEEDQLQLVVSEPMIKSSWKFLKAACRYDPALRMDDALQALRNVWIMNGLQLLTGKRVGLTPSVFAYSMLYPYTDNYLDDTSISTWEKIAFVDRFADRLSGQQVAPRNGHEARIYDMVALIETEWDRALYPDLYQSLLHIHTAQASSIRLIAGMSDLDFEGRLAVCVEKGGTSVVADGYLLSGRLGADEEAFLYAYGAYLQLMDDLQDLTEDTNAGMLTAFAFAAQTGPVDGIWNQALALGEKVIEQAGLLSSDYVPLFQALMQKSIGLFLVGTVQSNKAFYTDDFVAQMAGYLPLSAGFIRKKSSRLDVLQNPLFEKIWQQAVAMSADDEFRFLHKKSLLKQQA
jgi:hypothetical protein